MSDVIRTVLFILGFVFVIAGTGLAAFILGIVLFGGRRG